MIAKNKSSTPKQKNIMSLIKRIFDKSPFYLWQWIPAKRHTKDLVASLDWVGFETLKKYKNETRHPHYKKYFNIHYWLRKNMQRALYLHLNRIHKRLEILDLGAGFGYFPCAANFFGHETTALDLPGDTLFDEACKFLEVKQLHHTIQKKKPLTKTIKGSFDLITAFQICFNDHYEETPWGAKEWEFFIDHLLEKYLNEEGRIYLEFNYHHKLQDWMPEDVKKLFIEKYKAKLNGFSRVLISKSNPE